MSYENDAPTCGINYESYSAHLEKKLRLAEAELAALRAEAKAAVGPFARDVATLASNHAYNFAITLRGPNNEHLLTLLASDFEAARALLAKLGE